MRLFRKTTRAIPTPRLPVIRRAFPLLEELESRVVLSYSVSGNAWPNPQLITLSFVPDGTNLGGATSNLFSTLNAKWSTATWENQILKAAQAWAQQTNINFRVVSDSGADEGSGNYQQGDPTMGDIRISGYNYNSSTLAQALMPPPANNYSIAGDISFNTGLSWSIGGVGGYDLFTVAAHEIGHALGLYHSTTTSSVMYGSYNTVKTKLATDDINGIRNIYSSNNARSYDTFGGLNNGFAAASNLTNLIDGNSTVLETGLNLATATQSEYFTIIAPPTTNGTMTVTVQSSGLSLLAPTLTVYNSSQTQIGSVSGAGQYGTTVSVTINGVSNGQQFYVKVAGADTSAFATGNYALTFAFAGIAPPTVPLPNTQVLNGSPLQGSGGMALQSNPFQHNAGCNCPMCRGAAATAQQQTQQVVMPPVVKNAENPVAVVSAAPAPVIALFARPEIQTAAPESASSSARQSHVTPVPGDDLLWNSNLLTVPATVGALGSAPLTNAPWSSWSQAAEACFTSAGNSTGADDALSHATQGDGLAGAVQPATSAGMVVLLGGYWSAQAETSDRPVRRLFGL